MDPVSKYRVNKIFGFNIVSLIRGPVSGGIGFVSESRRKGKSAAIDHAVKGGGGHSEVECPSCPASVPKFETIHYCTAATSCSQRPTVSDSSGVVKRSLV